MPHEKASHKRHRLTRTVSVKKSISPQYAKRGSRRGDSEKMLKSEKILPSICCERFAMSTLLQAACYKQLATSSLLQATCCEAIQSVNVLITLKKRLEKLCARNGNYG